MKFEEIQDKAVKVLYVLSAIFIVLVLCKSMFKYLIS